MRTVEFEGNKFKYDEKCVKSYKWMKGATSGNLTKLYQCFERLFAGHDEEYADLLDDDNEKMQELITKCIEDMGQAKN